MEENEKEENEKYLKFIRNAFIIILVILVISILASNEDRMIYKEPNETEANTETNTKEETEPNEEGKNQEETTNNQAKNDNDEWLEKIRQYDRSSKCLNCKKSDDVYYVFKEDLYPNLKESIITSDQTPRFILKNDDNVTLTINWDEFCEWSFLKECPTGMIEYPITGINKKVKSTHQGGFGQTWEGTIFFYLLEDGTVYYTPLFSESEESNPILKRETNSLDVSFDNPTSFVANGPIEGVENITELRGISVGVYHGGGFSTTIAIKEDGTFYDLSKIIK